MTWRRWVVGLVAGTLGVLTAVGAAAGDDDIHACIDKRSGALREAGPKGDCSKQEVAIVMHGSAAAKNRGGTLTINGIPFKKTGTLPNSITINGTSFKRTGTLPNTLTINGNSFKGSSRGNTLTINGVAFRRGSGNTLTINGTAFAPGSAAQQGEPGPQGPQGPPGVQGSQGPSGTSHVYSATGAPSPMNGVGGITLSLPAGKYALAAAADAANTGGGRVLVCDLLDGGTLLERGRTSLPSGSAGAAEYASLALQATMTLDAAATITLRCSGGSSGGLTYEDFDLQAVAVDAVN